MVLEGTRAHSLHNPYSIYFRMVVYLDVNVYTGFVYDPYRRATRLHTKSFDHCKSEHRRMF